jgi:hypothetical protein
MITHMIQSETKQLHLISFTFPALTESYHQIQQLEVCIQLNFTCEIWGFHSRITEDPSVLHCEWFPKFWRIMFRLSKILFDLVLWLILWNNQKLGRKQAWQNWVILVALAWVALGHHKKHVGMFNRHITNTSLDCLCYTSLIGCVSYDECVKTS